MVLQMQPCSGKVDLGVNNSHALLCHLVPWHRKEGLFYDIMMFSLFFGFARSTDFGLGLIPTECAERLVSCHLVWQYCILWLR